MKFISCFIFCYLKVRTNGKLYIYIDIKMFFFIISVSDYSLIHTCPQCNCQEVARVININQGR